MNAAKITDVTDLHLLRILKKPEANCTFPVHLRRKSASYVTTHLINLCSIAIELIVSFDKVGIHKILHERNPDGIICKK
ncbi:unnamed protein product, partial [Dicrocoelium dendriticum]